MQPSDRQNASPTHVRDGDFASSSAVVTDWQQEQHDEWRRMVIFSQHREAVASAVITLYRAALATADTPVWQAPLYLRRMRTSIVLYFSPEAAELCKSVFDAFATDPTQRPRNLQAYALITGD